MGQPGRGKSALSKQKSAESSGNARGSSLVAKLNQKRSVQIRHSPASYRSQPKLESWLKAQRGLVIRPSLKILVHEELWLAKLDRR